jgi:hypothetical protein
MNRRGLIFMIFWAHFCRRRPREARLYRKPRVCANAQTAGGRTRRRIRRPRKARPYRKPRPAQHASPRGAAHASACDGRAKRGFIASRGLRKRADRGAARAAVSGGRAKRGLIASRGLRNTQARGAARASFTRPATGRRLNRVAV